MKIKTIILLTTLFFSTNIFADNNNKNNLFNNFISNPNLQKPLSNNTSNNKNTTAKNLPSTVLLKGLAFQFKLVGSRASYGVDVANKKVYLIFPECRNDMAYKNFKLNVDGTGQIELKRDLGEHIFTDLININKTDSYIDISSTARRTGNNRIKIELNFSCGTDTQCLGTNLPECHD